MNDEKRSVLGNEFLWDLRIDQSPYKPFEDGVFEIGIHLVNTIFDEKEWPSEVSQDHWPRFGKAPP